MISILIPTYNYVVAPLVHALHKQAMELEITFEIRIYDDCSPTPPSENEPLELLTHTVFQKMKQNMGRSAIRNRLAYDARYENLLFLDADTQIIRDDFIATYLDALETETCIIYGGIRYQEKPPPRQEMLRWKYGNAREALSSTERAKAPHLRFLTLNFLIKKNVFEKVRFNEDIPNLRHEDTLFALDCKKAGVPVKHIDNPVLHLGLETSEVFLRKSLESVHALKLFIDEGLIKPEETALSEKADNLMKKGLSKPVCWFYNRFKKTFENQLLSKNPNLFIFDVYRLGYYLNLER